MSSVSSTLPLDGLSDAHPAALARDSDEAGRPASAAFVARRLDLALDAFDDAGCLSQDDHTALRGARALAQSHLASAQAQAHAVLEAAQAEAARLRAEAADSARRLHSEHLAAWEEARPQLEACAVAIARAALQRLGHELDDTVHLQAAVRSAVKALPESPVRLLVPGAADAAAWPLDAGVEVLPGAAEPGSVTVCGTARDVAVDLEAARWEVHCSLTDWLREQLAAPEPPRA